WHLIPRGWCLHSSFPFLNCFSFGGIATRSRASCAPDLEPWLHKATTKRRLLSFAATPAALNRKLLQVSIDFSLTNRRAQVEAMPVLTPTTICSRRWAFARP